MSVCIESPFDSHMSKMNKKNQSKMVSIHINAHRTVHMTNIKEEVIYKDEHTKTDTQN